MPYLLFFKKQQNLKLPSAANYRWRHNGKVNVIYCSFDWIFTKSSGGLLITSTLQIETESPELLYRKSSKISKTFLFWAGSNKMFVRIANRDDPNQTASWVCTVCLFV